MGAFGGFIFGLFLGGCCAYGVYVGYRLRLAEKARSRQPAFLDGAEYFIVPAEEYGHLVTARDLARSAIRDLERRRHLAMVPAEDPYKDRRDIPRYQQRRDGGGDMSPRGGQLTPGS